ncbi:MAG: sugar phosphate isomerase/epimerase [Clostridiales bacterium]|nr:sugar phosphate isomerase/epimerase [Clostridiales bacterium]
MENGENLFDILKEVKDLGFDGVEFAGFYGYGADELKAKLDEYGLTAVGAHIGLEDLMSEKLDDTLKLCSVLGMNKIGVGSAPHRTAEDLNVTCGVLAEAYKEAAKHGVTIYYHNHSDEFYPLSDGRYPIDFIKPVCALEVDTYWSFFAGIDNYKFIRENSDRVTLLHIKDGLNGTPRALGEGDNDLISVAKIAKELNMEWVILENDDPEPDGLSDIARSIKFLKANF